MRKQIISIKIYRVGTTAMQKIKKNPVCELLRDHLLRFVIDSRFILSFLKVQNKITFVLHQINIFIKMS